MSGNKLYLIVILSLLSTTSCSASKKVSTNNKSTEIVDINTNNTDDVVDEIKSTDEVADVSIDSITKDVQPFDIDDAIDAEDDEVLVGEDESETDYLSQKTKIVVFLPFFINTIPLGKYANDTTKQLPNASKDAMDFYIGAKLAKESLSSFEPQVNLYFMDDQNSSDILQQKLKMAPFPNIDMIIAPYKVENIKLLADYGKQNKIPVLSSNNSSMYTTSNNPYYYSATPTIYGEYVALIENIKQQHPTKNITVLYDSTDTKNANINLIDNLLKRNKVKYNIIPSNKTVLPINTFSSNDSIFLFFSNDVNYIKSILKQASTITDKSLYFYTNSSINKNKDIVYKTFSHQLYTIAPYDLQNDDVKIFAQDYITDYVQKPTTLSYLGYDIMQFLFNMIEHNNNLLDYQDFAYPRKLQSNFKFVPVYNENNAIDFYDNSFVHYYHYNNGIFEKAD
ncbi:MAG: hypothetical protein R2801_11005 [Chitinophagales bacterium]